MLLGKLTVVHLRDSRLNYHGKYKLLNKSYDFHFLHKKYLKVIYVYFYLIIIHNENRAMYFHLEAAQWDHGCKNEIIQV